MQPSPQDALWQALLDPRLDALSTIEQALAAGADPNSIEPRTNCAALGLVCNRDDASEDVLIQCLLDHGANPLIPHVQAQGKLSADCPLVFSLRWFLPTPHRTSRPLMMLRACHAFQHEDLWGHDVHAFLAQGFVHALDPSHMIDLMGEMEALGMDLLHTGASRASFLHRAWEVAYREAMKEGDFSSAATRAFQKHQPALMRLTQCWIQSGKGLDDADATGQTVRATMTLAVAAGLLSQWDQETIAANEQAQAIARATPGNPSRKPAKRL